MIVASSQRGCTKTPSTPPATGFGEDRDQGHGPEGMVGALSALAGDWLVSAAREIWQSHAHEGALVTKGGLEK